jgi:hypothetical protein
LQKSGEFGMCVATVERRSFNVKSVHTFLVGFYLDRKLEPIQFRVRVISWIVCLRLR